MGWPLFGAKRWTQEITHFTCPVLNTTCVEFVHVGERNQWWLYIDGIPLAEVQLTPQGGIWLHEWVIKSVVPS